MEEKPKVNEIEMKVLNVLAEEYNDDMNCFYFRGIVSQTGLELKHVRRACRSLTKKGLAEFHRGLMNEDGEVAGSGYCATRAGASLTDPCDVCGDVSIYKYGGVKECQLHYGKSPKQGSLLPT